MQAIDIAKQFSTYYYGLFDSDRPQLVNLYKDNSLMTWEGKEYVGSKAIVTRLAALPFEKVAHQITTTDAQPCGNGLLVFFTGLLVVDAGDRPLQFSQCFHLQQNESGDGFWVANDIFRLNYG